MIDFELGGERLVPLAERALHWPARRTLIVADLHLGKAATFREAGRAVPDGELRDDLPRLDAALRRTGAERLVILGDLLHAREGRSTALLQRVTAWRERHPRLAIVLVRGNHDRSAGDPPAVWRVDCVDAPLREAPFVFAHEPAGDPAGPVIAGHLHPTVALRDAHGGRLRAPCFHLRAGGLVVPAFGGFTGGVAIRPSPGDRLFAVGPGRVVEVSVPRR